MKFIRRTMLAIAAGAALAACAQDARQKEPVAVPAVQPAPSTVSSLPPAYLGPAYSAAAVYQAISR